MSERPKPEEQPVISHVSGLSGMVKSGLVDMLFFCSCFSISTLTWDVWGSSLKI